MCIHMCVAKSLTRESSSQSRGQCGSRRPPQIRRILIGFCDGTCVCKNCSLSPNRVSCDVYAFEVKNNTGLSVFRECVFLHLGNLQLPSVHAHMRAAEPILADWVNLSKFLLSNLFSFPRLQRCCRSFARHLWTWPQICIHICGCTCIYSYAYVYAGGRLNTCRVCVRG